MLLNRYGKLHRCLLKLTSKAYIPTATTADVLAVAFCAAVGPEGVGVGIGVEDELEPPPPPQAVNKKTALTKKVL
jgi:hypothetical protein